MDFKVIGENVERWDAVSKVIGKAEYTGDIPTKKMLYGKIARSTIAHGIVTSLNIEEALKVPGVVKVLTPDDVPDISFPTAGHPYTLDSKAADVADRNILTKRIRLYGDEIAAVIAETQLAADIAVSKITATYEEWPFYLTPEESLAEDAIEIHDGSKNKIAHTVSGFGDVEKGFSESDLIVEDTYQTQTVQHCHMECQIAYAYQDVDGRWVCVSSTQIPHICRRVLGQAFGMPWGQFRVIKPFIGGGFGNKQDVTIEPLVVAMSMAVGGKPVMIDLPREESLAWTRVRHALGYKVKMGVTKEGLIKSAKFDVVSNNGAYASHGHSIGAKGGGVIASLYKMENLHYEAATVYTNTAAAGAMRGYGVPQLMFALESLMEKVARQLKMDPTEFRLKNIAPIDEVNKVTHIVPLSNNLDKCLIEGKALFNWDEKQAIAEAYNNRKDDSNLRRGVGLATFAYASGTYPKCLEIGGCRLILNQDGSVKMMVGATEIGQGSDTAFRQMVAETLGISPYKIYADNVTDTDIAPFDTGAYASRQSFVTGMAVKKAAQELRGKIEDAVVLFEGVEKDSIDIIEGNIVYKHNKKLVTTLGDLALKTYYDINKGQCLTADVSNKCLYNAYPFGVTFAEVEIDMDTGKTTLLSVLNVHDSGKIINPLLAEGQVQGGMSMGIAYGLSEELKYDGKTGKPLNNNLLDYKIPTFMDTPDLDCAFVEEVDPVGPYGNKSLGEPPVCSPAPAIRNAIFNALDVEFNKIPITPQDVIEACVLEQE